MALGQTNITSLPQIASLLPSDHCNHKITTAGEHSSEPAAPEQPCVKAPEGPIPLVFTRPGQVCK